VAPQPTQREDGMATRNGRTSMADDDDDRLSVEYLITLYRHEAEQELSERNDAEQMDREDERQSDR
jgi:hypothetical protein